MTRNQIGAEHLALVEEAALITGFERSKLSHPARGYNAKLDGAPLRQDAQEDQMWLQNQPNGGVASGPGDQLFPR